ncbi:hypothetical protein LTR28_005058 [Elasticomyces elasticus]|nr:hypothetical protein LTR28_005058 [Elasticomyces elasticus]
MTGGLLVDALFTPSTEAEEVKLDEVVDGAVGRAMMEGSPLNTVSVIVMGSDERALGKEAVKVVVNVEGLKLIGENRLNVGLSGVLVVETVLDVETCESKELESDNEGDIGDVVVDELFVYTCRFTCRGK